MSCTEARRVLYPKGRTKSVTSREGYHAFVTPTWRTKRGLSSSSSSLKLEGVILFHSLLFEGADHVLNSSMLCTKTMLLYS
jgi:hypothetical protein